jgi:hypothetical protein
VKEYSAETGRGKTATKTETEGRGWRIEDSEWGRGDSAPSHRFDHEAVKNSAVSHTEA